MQEYSPYLKENTTVVHCKDDWLKMFKKLWLFTVTIIQNP